jgi:Domain of unknown function (DUF6134)
MPLRRLTPALALACVLIPTPGRAQSVVVDEGTFALTIAGKPAGTETFQIRRAGMGTAAIAIAQGQVQLDGPDGHVELSPILEDSLASGVAASYHLKVTGGKLSELSLKRAGRRYLSLIRSSAGEEQREFLARPGTHILEEDVAHQYYFLRDAAPGSSTPIIEPRTRREFELTASAPTDEELHLGPNVVQARKVTFTDGSDVRTVWYDRQGRVLRVEIPARGYVAERKDLVG